ncbi:carbohydrate ABC transporter permease [Cohnella fermenti]|uniref:Sugar ABC transporter permease n=1 Tax=Cohnella fermenti TaxID=2565925 RepID=A0A4S4BS18_9BACL|nr:sugar ABC transporter permease [Cohnella fermenti]THF75507.1 sugar ABC transporter permease [Cohnella fermenti]
MQRKIYLSGLVFMAPITIIIFVFLVYPILQSMFYSLTDWTGVGGYRFIGLSNYTDIFKDEGFTDALKRTLFIGLTTAVLANLFGLFFAVLLDQSLKTKNVLRALFYIPNVIPTVVAAFVWRYILDSNTGMLNKGLVALFGEKGSILWLDSPDYVVYTIIGITVWAMWGPILIIYLAALQGVPHEMKEAMMIDGATKRQSFVHLTLPMIAPGITVNVLIGLANGLRIFDLPFALTGGGPAGASETLSVKIYRYAFSSTELSYGLSASFILTVIALVVTFFFIALSRKYEKGTIGG